MLFDKNGIYYMDDNDDYDFAVDIINGNMDNSPSKEIYDLQEALKRGNAFKDLYSGYKGYRPYELKANTQKEKDMLYIQMLAFSINDLNLYLDLYPNDSDVYKLFSRYVMELKDKKEEFARKYYPIVMDNLKSTYEWSSGTWPWEVM